MSTYDGDAIADLDETTPTTGTWTVPEVDDALREIKRALKNDLGNSSSSTITRNLVGNTIGTHTGPVIGDVTGNVSGSSGSCTGNSATTTSAINATNATNATGTGTAVYSDIAGIKIISGEVGSSGNIVSGSGFTVTKGATGVYIINFTVPFSARARIIVTGIAAYLGTGQSTTGNSAVVVMYIPTSSAIDTGFNFMAIGPK